MGSVDHSSFDRTLGELLARAKNPRKPLTEIGILMVSEMQENFRVQGRPETWAPSARAKREGGQTLRDTGTLMTGIVSEVADGSVAAGPTMVGRNHITDPRVLRLLAFGGTVERHGRAAKKPGKKSFGTKAAHYPRRDYTYIPPQANKTYGEILQNFLLGGQ